MPDHWSVSPAAADIYHHQVAAVMALRGHCSQWSKTFRCSGIGLPHRACLLPGTEVLTS